MSPVRSSDDGVQYLELMFVSLEYWTMDKFREKKNTNTEKYCRFWQPANFSRRKNPAALINILRKKDKAIPITGRGGPQVCKTSMILHFLKNQFTDDGVVVSLTCRPPFNPRKISGTHFC
jgi:hypothetical protein